MFNLREKFISFFQKKGHKKYKESSLIPSKDDKTLLFTNSGMVQFKKYLTGSLKCKDSRVTTCQPCIRAGGKHNDIENVGQTHRHHTMFEMLGNFSFNDYSKKKAIEFAWEFVTEILKFDINKIWITVYTKDTEAKNIWMNFIKKERIIKLDENFWSSGSAGPCGYCSEIFYDRGDKFEGNIPGQGEEGDRYIEIWNLVFVEFFQDEQMKLQPLSSKGIDTGMGFERVQSIIENKDSAYETSIFYPIIKKIEEILSCKYENNKYLFRIIADHLRSVSFLVSQGVMPSNEKQGYVVRKLMRRVFVELYKIGKNKSIFVDIYESLIESFRGIYTELEVRKNYIINVLEEEFNMFQKILLKAESMILKLENLNEKQASTLYETHGISFDVSNIISKKHYNKELNKDKFEKEYKKHHDKSLGTWNDQIDNNITIDNLNINNTEFLGYDNLSCSAKVIYCKQKDSLNKKLYEVAFNKTPFYATSGGQKHDEGCIYLLDKNQDYNKSKYAKCINVQNINNVFLHTVESDFSIKKGDICYLKVDNETRHKSSCNHTATHILHYIIRETHGQNIVQKGSYVDDKKLRFNFNFNRLFTTQELLHIEQKMNEFILKSFNKKRNIENSETALKRGVIGLFEQKYNKDVFVIEFGSSKEICGGTHVDNTSQIGLFKITSHSSIGAGIKKIEAVTNIEAYKLINQKELLIENIKKSIKTQKDTDITDKLNNLKQDLYIQKTNNFFAKYGDLYVKCSENLTQNEMKNIIPKNSTGLYCIINFNKDKYSIIAYSASENFAKNILSKKFIKCGGNKNFAILGGNKKDIFNLIGSSNNKEFISNFVSFINMR